MFSYVHTQWRLGRAIYGKRSWRETRRVILHTVRSLRNKREMHQLEDYFSRYSPDVTLLQRQVGLYELMTRIFLYKNSTVKERLQAITEHFDYLRNVFTDDAIRSMYAIDPDNFYDDVSRMNRGIIVWKSEDLQMEARLYYGAGQRKEGFLTLLLTYENQGIYHANFRFGRGFHGEPAMWIGTVQGYKDGLSNAKTVTKKMFGYRPKNFMIFVLRELARACGAEAMYAVSDEGFYANTHLIRGHKAKVAELDSLWLDMGGIVCDDPRFYQLPLLEIRKPIEEIKSQKRSQYKKRYDLLDTYIAEIRDNIAPYLKNQAQ